MPSWLLSLLGIAVSAFLQFYFRWVPEVGDQKRHVRQAAWWALDIGTVVSQVWPLYALSHVNGPVTPSLIVRGALFGAGLAFCSMMAVMRRTYGNLLNEHISRYAAITELHEKTFAKRMETLEVMIKRVDLTAEFAARLNRLLGVNTQSGDSPKD